MSNRLAAARGSDRVPAPTFAYQSEAELLAAVQDLRAREVAAWAANRRARREAARAAAPANSNDLALATAEYDFVIRRANEMRAERMAELLVAAGRWIGRVVGSWRKGLDEARAMRELAGLDDRMLADIGVSRSDIPALVRRAREDVIPAPQPKKPLHERLAA